ncbi:MAG TPA: hypothetical protein VER11_16385 [Polyangiaceae bacterium]|nr:hypothetical protein [Polyangiaceae bacterium]
MNRFFAVATLCLTVAACEKKDAPASADSAKSSNTVEAPAAPSAVPVAVAPPVVDVSTLPVEEDFEADAEKELTVANLSAKLDDLDKEISAP